MQRSLNVPASFFGIIVGLVGLGNCWRAASRLWSVPQPIGEALMAIAVAAWVVLVVLYLAKWIWARPLALAEFNHPIQCCFIGLVPVSTLLIALAVLPYSHELASILFAIGAVGQLTFGVHRTGTLWTGGRDVADTSSVAFLPTVAGGFVTAIAAGALGEVTLGKIFFGAGLFSWFALESVILRRLMETPTMAAPLRPTLGIHFAPPVVGCIAYLSITTGEPDMVALALFGYGVFQGLVLVRLLPWLCAAAFGPSYWAYTFATTACSLAAICFVERGLTGPIEWLALVLFVIANLVIGAIALRTVWLLARGRLLPPLPPVAAPTT